MSDGERYRANTPRLIEIVNIFLPVLVMVASFAGYTLVEKKQLTAATVFTSMTVFEILRNQMMMVGVE